MSKERKTRDRFPHVPGLAKKRTKFGHRWILTEKDPTGKSRSITVKILDNDPADVFFRKISEARLELRKKTKCKSLGAYLHEYAVIKQLSKNTILLYERCLSGFSFDAKENKKRVHEILMADRKASTTKVYIGKIDTFFNWLIRRGEPVVNPVSDIHIKSHVQPRKRTLTDEEMQVILNYARRRKDKAYTLFILLLIETGARVSTICQLRLKDIDNNWFIHLYNVKSKKEYDYQLKIQSEEIRSLITERRNIGTLWNESADKYNMRFREWMHIRFQRDSTGEALSPHSIRHTFASRAIQNGVPLEIVSKLLDHSSPNITLKVYARFSQEQINDAMEKATKKAMIGANNQGSF